MRSTIYLAAAMIISGTICPLSDTSKNAVTAGMRGFEPPLFAEDSDLHLLLLAIDVIHIYIDRQVRQLIDNLFEIFRLDLAYGKGNALVVQCLVDVVAGLRRNEAGQLYSGTQELHGNAGVHADWPMRLRWIVGLDHHTKVFGLRTAAWLGGAGCRLYRISFQSGDQTLRLFGRNLATGQHLKNLSASFAHWFLLLSLVSS